MCGIFGWVSNEAGRADADVARVVSALRKRGPDEDGSYKDPHATLAHTRLSIIDLSGGSQPIYNEDKSLVLVYNGEIYNFHETRERLLARGHLFRSNTDGEILVHLYEEGGDFLAELNGMFAFIVWDMKKRVLFAARDRFGTKPLYWTRTPGGGLALSSEIRALFAAGAARPEINFSAVDKYFTHRFNKGNDTAFRGVMKVPPGQSLRWEAGGARFDTFWKVPESLDYLRGTEEELAEEYESLFRRAVRRQLLSDVPLGLFLSGGTDSASICGAMSDEGAELRTYTFGFKGAADESGRAAAVAGRFHASHKTFTPGPEILWRLPEIQGALEEPFGDMIVVPTHHLAENAARDVKVVLTGEGADETMGGYIHQKALFKFHESPLLRAFGRLASGLIGMVPVGMLDSFFDYPASMGREGRERLRRLFACRGDVERHATFVSLFSEEEKEGLYSDGLSSALGGPRDDLAFLAEVLGRDGMNFFDRLIMNDVAGWLCDNILFKVDKLCMDNSLEGRFPFLDNDLADFTLRLPLEMKLNGGRNKHLLKRVAEKSLLKGFDFKGKKPFYFSPARMYPDDFDRLLRERLTKDRIDRMGFLNWNHVAGLLGPSREMTLLAEKKVVAVLCLLEWHDQFFK